MHVMLYNLVKLLITMLLNVLNLLCSNPNQYNEKNKFQNKKYEIINQI